jgi:HEAT repeat protein
MGSSYFIAGVDTDLRETGSIEDVRRFSVATCPTCRYSDYSWDFDPEDLTDEAKRRIKSSLEKPDAPRPSGKRVVSDFDRLALAARCFSARGLDASSRAELALLTYYVARDLGRRDLEPMLRDGAAGLFEEALAAEDLPPPLALRYAYITGELHRRAGRRDEALAFLERAIEASREGANAEIDEPAPSFDLGAFARRQRAAILHENDTVPQLVKLTKSDDQEEASEARRLLARRRGKQAQDAIKRVFKDAPTRDRVAMLRELVHEPPGALFELFTKGLKSESPEEVRLSARVLGALADARALEPLIEALERGVLATEIAIADALRRIDAPEKFESIKGIVEKWSKNKASSDDAWHFGSDPTPLKALLYASGERYGFELLVEDMRAISENDLWDKPPSGSPVQAAIALDRKSIPALKKLLKDKNPCARRWASYCLSELPRARDGASDLADELRPLLKDKDRAVRLEAACGVGKLAGHDAKAEKVVLEELAKLDESDLPFALHFLVPFKSDKTKKFILDLLDRGVALPGEVYPLLGRQGHDSKVKKLLEAGLQDGSDDARAGAVTGLSFLASDGGSGSGNGGSRSEHKVTGRLRALFDEEDADDVKRRIIFALARLAQEGHDKESTVEFLRAQLEGGDRRLRFPIALALLQLGDDTAIEDVRERAALFDESADHYDLVAPALKALAQFERSEAAAT